MIPANAGADADVPLTPAKLICPCAFERKIPNAQQIRIMGCGR